ncbi:MAG: cobalamin-dependent protein [Thermodesulfobacteriota bacterium]
MRITFVHLGREHLGLEYLSSIVRREGHQVSLAYDPGLFGPEDNVFCVPALERLFDQRRQVLAAIRESSPDLIAFTVYTGTYQWARGIAAEIRRSLKVPIVFGGIHATLVPEVIIADRNVDFVIQGEAFAAFPDLVAVLASGRGRLDDVSNLWFKRNGVVMNNPLAPPLADLDSLPFPDKTLFENDVNYVDDYVIITSLGCVFNCSYCCESTLNRLYRHQYYRRRSVASVMAELTVMKARYRFKEVMFNDALFFTDREWLRQLMAAYREKISVPFRCFGKVSHLDDDICRMLADGGCYCIEFGMQTWNEDLKRSVLHRNETNAMALEAFGRCDRFGLRYDIDHIFGLPGETVRDHVDGLRYYSRLKRLNRIKCHNLTCFPNTTMARYAREHNVLGAEDEDKLKKGEISDFFHGDAIRDGRLKKAKDLFSKCYKLLPIIPDIIVRRLIRSGDLRVFDLIPKPIVIIGQLLVAVKGRDYRYLVYLKYYPLRIKRSFRRKWSGNRKVAKSDG